jgi:hypothetical protein
LQPLGWQELLANQKQNTTAASSGLMKLFRHAGLDPASSVPLFWIPAFALDSTPPRTGISPDAENTLYTKHFYGNFLRVSFHCLLKMQYATALRSMGSFYYYLLKLCYNKFLLIYFFLCVIKYTNTTSQNVEAFNLILLIIKQSKKNFRRSRALL